MNVFQVNPLGGRGSFVNLFLLEFRVSVLILSLPEIDTLSCRGINENCQKICFAMYGFYSDMQHHFPKRCVRDYAETGRRAVSRVYENY